MFVEFQTSWEGANTLCGDASGGKATLTSINSQDENDHVESLFNYKNGLTAWIGGSTTSKGRFQIKQALRRGLGSCSVYRVYKYKLSKVVKSCQKLSKAVISCQKLS